MTREDVINERIHSIQKDIASVDKKILKEAKSLIDTGVLSATLEKIVKYKTERHVLYSTQTELYGILGTHIKD